MVNMCYWVIKTAEHPIEYSRSETGMERLAPEAISLSMAKQITMRTELHSSQSRLSPHPLQIRNKIRLRLDVSRPRPFLRLIN